MKCLICNKDCKNLEAHIRRLHKISREEYSKQFSYNGPFMIPMSDEAKAKMIAKKKGKTPWNKGLTKETDSRVKGRKGWKMTKEQRDLVSKRTKEAMQRPEVKEKLKYICYNFKSNTPEVKAKVSKASRQNWKDDNYAAKCANNRFGKKTKYNNIVFRSKIEAAYAKYMDEHTIKYEYEKHLFEYELNGVLHNYRPDFYLPEYDTFLEVKSRINKEDKLVLTKLNALRKQGKRILLVDSTMLNKLIYIL